MGKTVFLIFIITTAAIGLFLYHDRQEGGTPPSRPGEQRQEHFFRPSHSLPGPRATADLVYLEKKARRLTLYRGGKRIGIYRVALGFEPVGRKTTEGDGRTPEGRYIIDCRKANSRFHRALHISYPNAQDKRQAAARGVSPGGDIMIHGLKNGMGWIGKAHLASDWTLGCIALTNGEMDEVWQSVPDGTPVEIVP